jgi:carbamoyl-phosphate synthase/aspartate carbamoyltransferase/dihydroorotase
LKVVPPRAASLTPRTRPQVNARLSRSSALASKATGYPLAFVAAKLLLGQPLPKIRNSVTGSTTACFEPSLDYLVVKMPRWDLKKFPRVSKEIGSQMKSTGEVMAIGRRFEEGLQKAMRMLDGEFNGFVSDSKEGLPLTDANLKTPTDERLPVIAKAMRAGYTLDRLYKLTRVDKWFLSKLFNIVNLDMAMEKMTLKTISADDLRYAKQIGFCDSQIGKALSATSLSVRQLRNQFGISPVVKLIDTVAGEFPAVTNYLYVTYNGNEHDLDMGNEGAVMVLGSGVYRIGCSVEFDWCGVRCARTLRQLGYKVIVVNYNPETVSTDYDESDRLYFDELSFETVYDIYQMENPLGIIMCMGGQVPNNIAMKLHRTGDINILGTSAENIDGAENRFKFSRMLDNIGIEQPKWRELTDTNSACTFCREVGYPCVVRPSYVLSGAAMNVAYSDSDLTEYLGEATTVSKDHPVVVSKMIVDAKEIDVDAVAMNGVTQIILVMEHVENAGVHSGDATMITPPQDLTPVTIEKIKEITRAIGKALNVSGPYNLQLIAKDDELKVIECNLRVSRSLPFSSKTRNVDMIGLSTRIIMNEPFVVPAIPVIDYVGVKVSQFSFSRLPGADPTQGVDMHSTGEVACFGSNHYEAYLKAMLSTGFMIPRRTVLLSIGTFKGKQEFLNAVRTLFELGYEVYGSSGTADFYTEYNLPVKTVEWPYGNDGQLSTDAQQDMMEAGDESEMSMMDLMASGRVDLVINLPMRKKSHSPAAFVTQGYLTRRTAIDYSIPLITDIKCGKLFIQAMSKCNLRALAKGVKTDARKVTITPCIDSFSAHRVVQLPGFVDTQCHVRQPGGEHKEDWQSATSAALAGGFTAVCAMPNTMLPAGKAVVDAASFGQACELAQANAKCDYAVFIGADRNNAQKLESIGDAAAGLMMYLNQNFTEPRLDSMSQWRQHLESWPKHLPVVVHAESHSAGAVILTASLCDRAVHICNVARREEMELIVDAKKRGLSVTCACAPHHLFMTEADAVALGAGKASVCPRLQSADDQQALWDNLEHIDCFASYHAPHTLAEKTGEDPPPGFPSLETALPLFFTAVAEGKLTLEQLVEKLHTNPRRIFQLPLQPDTHVEVDLDEEWVVPDVMPFSKSGWTPYAGRKVVGRVQRVVLRGEIVFLDGSVLADPGTGQNLKDSPMSPEVRPRPAAPRHVARPLLTCRGATGPAVHQHTRRSDSHTLCRGIRKWCEARPSGGI